MFNTNFQPGFQSPVNGNFPGFGGFGGGMSSLGSMQQMFTQTMNMMQMTMMTLMTQMMSQQVAMPGSSSFGAMGGGTPQASPLGGFLGSAGGASASKSPSGNGAKRQGGKIPGGKDLYKGKGMFHKGAPGAPDTYAFENSPAGIKFAAKHGYKSIDIDMQITKDGVPVATHWDKPMAKDGFYDPKGKLGKNTKVSDMTLAEVMRLRNKDGKSQISTVATMVKLLKQNGIAGDFEAKGDKRFATPKVMSYLADLVRDAGIKANLKTIDHGSLSDKILKAAQEQGFWVRTAKGGGHAAKQYGYGN